MSIPHPDPENIELADVLTALGDETRLAMLGYIFRNDEAEMTCGQFLSLGSKTVLSYHLAKLREAGVVRVRPEGTKRLISLRRHDLDHRFPGFLDSIAATALTAAGTAIVPDAAIVAAGDAGGWD